jgi:hypothetical protein
MSSLKAIKILAWICIINFSYSAMGQAHDLPDDSWLMPFAVKQRFVSDPKPLAVTQEDVYEFAWQSFIALNWPYLTGGNRGQPDINGSLAPIQNDDLPLEPVVWETYLKPSEVFIEPRGWNVIWDIPETPIVADDSRILLFPGYSETFAPGINQPYINANVPTGPVTTQSMDYLWYEVTLGQSYFTYIKQFKYFNADRQKKVVGNFLRFVSRHTSAPPPVTTAYQRARFFQPVPMGLEFYLENLPIYAQQGLVEVKAAWKILQTSGENADIPGRYFRRLVQFKLPDGSITETKLAGLVGFHIHRVTPPFPEPLAPGQRPLPNHLPSTFEHVDNVRVSDNDCGASLPKPAHPSLNPGQDSDTPPPYLNGYEIAGTAGKGGAIPAPILAGEHLPPKNERPLINASRVTPIPDEVQKINRKYQKLLKGSVWCFYQLVGSQNKSLQESNPHLGPGLAGAQTSNVQNLVNSTLETFTQNGFSCARCHLNAFPQGVGAFPPFEKKYIELRVMSFLLQSAKSRKQNFAVKRHYRKGGTNPYLIR